MSVEPSVNATTAVLRANARPGAEELRRFSAGVMVGALCGVAGIVAWRRLAGALTEPLPVFLLLPVGVVAVTLAVGVRRLVVVSRQGRLMRIMPSVAVVVLGLALSLPQTGVVELLMFWLILLGGELWLWRPDKWRRPRPGKSSAGKSIAGKKRQVLPEAPSPEIQNSGPIVSSDGEEVPADNVLQQLTRSRGADGSEQLAGWLRMPFGPGQRTASLHVAFCPPFDRRPEIDVAQCDGPTTRVKTTQLLPYGARLDLKLAAPPEKPESVLLQFSARLDAASGQ